MTAEVIRVSEDQLNLQEYKAEWKLSNISSLGTGSLLTSVFYPLHNVEVGFCFEIWYQEIYVVGYNSACFKLVLKKKFCIDIPEALKMDTEVSVLYNEGSVFKTYAPIKAVVVKDMSILGFEDFVYRTTPTPYYSNAILKIKCCMRFFDHLDAMPLLAYKLESSCKPSNLCNFAKDFLTIYSPCVLGDIQFNIGTKTLRAHKFLLAAHSPEFFKMFTQESQESNTLSIVITDFTYDCFEKFLKFLYSGKIEDKSMQNLRDLFAIAEKYDVHTLKRESAEIAVTLLSVENIFDVIELVYRYGEQELIETTKKFAAVHIEELFSDEKWNELVKSQLVIAYEVMAAAYNRSKQTMISKSVAIEGKSQ